MLCLLQQIWLQEVAWTEADKPIMLAARSAMIPKNLNIEQQPIFCYETMLKLLYWSCLVYDHDRVMPCPFSCCHVRMYYMHLILEQSYAPC